MSQTDLKQQLSQARIISQLASEEISDASARLTEGLARRSSDFIIISSGFVAWMAFEPDGSVVANALGNHQRLYAEFYTGGANTVFSDDPIPKYRGLIDTPFSKAQIRRQERVPRYSYRVGIEHYGVVTAVECPIGMYIDRESVLVSIRCYPGGPCAVYASGQPWVPEFLDIDAVLNMVVIPLELAREKIPNYFGYCLNAVQQASQERAVILETIRDLMHAF